MHDAIITHFLWLYRVYMKFMFTQPIKYYHILRENDKKNLRKLLLQGFCWNAKILPICCYLYVMTIIIMLCNTFVVLYIKQLFHKDISYLMTVIY